MKRTVKVLLAAAVGLAAIAGCGSNGATTGGGSSAASTIKVGLLYELSGGVATYGQASVEGIKMAIDEVNAAGGVNGKQIELKQYDSKSEPAEATTLATKLMTTDKVVTIIGPATSGSFKATIPVANANKIPVVSGSATLDDVTVKDGKVNEYAFRTCFNDSYQGTAMANYATKQRAAKTAVILRDSSSDYSKGLAENFKKTFTANGGSIVGEEAYVTGETNFSPILTRIKGMTYDVIYLPGYYNEAGLIIKQARGLGITQPILGGDGYDSPVLLQQAGAAALTNVYFTNHYSSLDKDPKVTKFIADWKAKKGSNPSAFHALGYDTGKFVADALKRAGANPTGEAVKKAMAETKDFPGVTGTFSMDANHNPVKGIVVIQMTNGVEASSEKASS